MYSDYDDECWELDSEKEIYYDYYNYDFDQEFEGFSNPLDITLKKEFDKEKESLYYDDEEYDESLEELILFQTQNERRQ